jgi:CO dehydrogenase/acetyl-CoA synthase delta subunit
LSGADLFMMLHPRAISSMNALIDSLNKKNKTKR